MRLLVILITLLAVFSDLHLYRRYVRRSRFGAVRWSFIVFAALTDASIFLSWIVFRFVGSGTASLHAMMWITACYLMLVLPRTMAGLFSALDWIVSDMASRRVRLFAPIGALFALVLTVVLVWGLVVGRQRIRVNRVVIRTERLPEAFDGLRIVHISDLHVGSMVHPVRALGRLTEVVATLDPDLIAVTGDLVTIRFDEVTPAIEETLRGIRAPEGVYSVFGNHDLGFYLRDTVALSPDRNKRMLVEMQQGMGWTVLDDSTLYLRRGGDSIALTGLGFPPDHRIAPHNQRLAGVDFERAYRHVPDGIYNVTLSHTPQLWEEILARRRGDLTLAGHVHAMQLKVRLLGHYISPASYLYPEWSGLYRRNDHSLYVNDGYGYVGFPMRIGADPEVTLIELRRP